MRQVNCANHRTSPVRAIGVGLAWAASLTVGVALLCLGLMEGGVIDSSVMKEAIIASLAVSVPVGALRAKKSHRPAAPSYDFNDAFEPVRQLEAQEAGDLFREATGLTPFDMATTSDLLYIAIQIEKLDDTLTTDLEQAREQLGVKGASNEQLIEAVRLHGILRGDETKTPGWELHLEAI